jgi:predicted RecA/RadA family phage recombinase
MIANRQTLEAGVATLFEFDEFYYRSILVKNMTAGAIEFCEGTFDTSKSAVIPAYGWQLFNLTIPYSSKPKFYVKARSAGDVEIDFGSDGMGIASNVCDIAGMIPHVLTFNAGEDTTLSVKLTRLHGQTLDLGASVDMASGATVFCGDIILITPAAEEAGDYAMVTINGVNYGRLESNMSLKISGDTNIETEAVALDPKTLTLTEGDNTTLTAAKVRLAGMLTDLSEAEAVIDSGTIHVGDVIEFTAETEEGDGYHVTLTIDGEPVELDKDGKIRVTVEDNIVAVSASVTDEGGD